MFEGSRGRKVQRLLQFLDERVRVECVEKVDVTRGAAQSFMFAMSAKGH